MTTGGSVVYALWAGLTSAVSCRCCTSPAHNDQLNKAEKGLGPASGDKSDRVSVINMRRAQFARAVSRHCCCSPAHDDQLDEAENGVGPASGDKPDRVTSVVASFDA